MVFTLNPTPKPYELPNPKPLNNYKNEINIKSPGRIKKYQTPNQQLHRTPNLRRLSRRHLRRHQTLFPLHKTSQNPPQTNPRRRPKLRQRLPKCQIKRKIIYVESEAIEESSFYRLDNRFLNKFSVNPPSLTNFSSIALTCLSSKKVTW